MTTNPETYNKQLLYSLTVKRQDSFLIADALITNGVSFSYRYNPNTAQSCFTVSTANSYVVRFLYDTVQLYAPYALRKGQDDETRKFVLGRSGKDTTR